MPTSMEQARAAKAAAKKTLAGISAIIGIGITRVGANYALKINLREALPAGTLPTKIEGVRVYSEVVGRIHKQT